MPTPEFCSWAAGHLLDDLRNGRVPDDVTPGDFAWHPMSTAVRAVIDHGDLELTRGLAGKPETVMWAAMLSRQFLDHPDLTEALVSSFDAETDIERRIGLLHHISTRRLDDAQYALLRSWLQAHATDFIAEQQAAFDDVDGPGRLLDRLSSDEPGFVRKRWVYMYSAHALGATHARTVLNRHLDDADQRVVDAARHSLSLLG